MLYGIQTGINDINRLIDKGNRAFFLTHPKQTPKVRFYLEKSFPCDILLPRFVNYNSQEAMEEDLHSKNLHERHIQRDIVQSYTLKTFIPHSMSYCMDLHHKFTALSFHFNLLH